MSKIRQTALIRTFGVTFHSPQSFAYRVQGWDQLIYAIKGVITVRAARDAWVLPAQRALWAPAEVDASIEIPGPVSLRSLYFKRGLVKLFPRQCTVVNVSPLLKELILYAVRLGVLDKTVPEQKRLARVIVDQLKLLPSVPLQLPMPADARAKRAASLMQADPATAIERIARRAGASVRTLERLFREETNMPLGSWRRRMRLLHALRLLASGESVTQVALATGYESISAFVVMFRRELGVTPARYFTAQTRAPGGSR